MYKIIPLCLLLTSCTYSIHQIHTEGQATDVVDETQSPTTSMPGLDNIIKKLQA
jgi:hypothetical protein